MPLKSAILATKVDPETHARFLALAAQHGGASHVLRTFVLQAMDGNGGVLIQTPAAPEHPAVYVGLKPHHYAALRKIADQRGATLAATIRAMIEAWLDACPQWSDAELQSLREIGEGVRNLASAIEQAEMEAPAAVAAAEELRSAVMAPIVALVTGNMEFWNKRKNP